MYMLIADHIIWESLELLYATTKKRLARRKMLIRAFFFMVKNSLQSLERDWIYKPINVSGCTRFFKVRRHVKTSWEQPYQTCFEILDSNVRLVSPMAVLVRYCWAVLLELFWNYFNWTGWSSRTNQINIKTVSFNWQLGRISKDGLYI